MGIAAMDPPGFVKTPQAPLETLIYSLLCCIKLQISVTYCIYAPSFDTLYALFFALCVFCTTCRHHRPEQRRVEQRRVEQRRVEQRGVEQRRVEQRGVEQRRVEQRRAEQSRTPQNRTEQSRTERDVHEKKEDYFTRRFDFMHPALRSARSRGNHPFLSVVPPFGSGERIRFFRPIQRFRLVRFKQSGFPVEAQGLFF